MRPTRARESTCCSAASCLRTSTAASSGRPAYCRRIAPSTTRAWRSSATARRARWSTASPRSTAGCCWIRECSRGTTQPDGSVRVDGIVTDVSEQRARDHAASALEDVLSATRGRLDSVLSAIDEYLYAWRYPVHGPAVVDFESMPLAAFLDRERGPRDPEEEWLDAVHPDDREMVAEHVLEAQLAGLPGSVEYRTSTGTAARAGCSTAGAAGASRVASSPRASSPTSPPASRRRTAWRRRWRARRSPTSSSRRRGSRRSAPRTPTR